MKHNINKTIANKVFPNERDLYNLQNAKVKNCKFSGPEDGESALKECRDVIIENCKFDLRYPLWHAKDYTLKRCEMTDTARAGIWYANNGEITDCKLNGIKVLRECRDTIVKDTSSNSLEFGWNCNNISVSDSEIISEYAFYGSNDATLNNVIVQSKYSFQYMNNLKITNCEFFTKDAFWHSNNITVKNSVLEGEYLAWFSNNLTLINCEIKGTQPFCYCNNLRLINCTMEGCDLAFEYADAEAEVYGHLVSIKNPKSGIITVDKVDEIIWKDAIMECNGKVKIRKSI